MALVDAPVGSVAGVNAFAFLMRPKESDLVVYLIVSVKGQEFAIVKNVD